MIRIQIPGIRKLELDRLGARGCCQHHRRARSADPPIAPGRHLAILKKAGA
jgi:hypothetical protein